MERKRVGRVSNCSLSIEHHRFTIVHKSGELHSAYHCIVVVDMVRSVS